MKLFWKSLVGLPETSPRRQRNTGFENVADYRLYGLDGVEKVASAVWIEADDDQAAIAAGKEILNGRKGELWQRGRFVAKLTE